MGNNMNIMRLIYYQISLLLFFFSPGPAETVYLSQSSWNSVNRKVDNLSKNVFGVTERIHCRRTYRQMASFQIRMF